MFLQPYATGDESCLMMMDAYMEAPRSRCSSPAPRGSGVAQCQVEGCLADLACEEKPYCLKKRICSEHLKADFIMRPSHGAEPFRWCFQCGKLELLSNFDGARRSCRLRLQRRKLPPRRSATWTAGCMSGQGAAFGQQPVVAASATAAAAASALTSELLALQQQQMIIEQQQQALWELQQQLPAAAAAAAAGAGGAGGVTSRWPSTPSIESSGASTASTCLTAIMPSTPAASAALPGQPSGGWAGPACGAPAAQQPWLAAPATAGWPAGIDAAPAQALPVAGLPPVLLKQEAPVSGELPAQQPCASCFAPWSGVPDAGGAPRAAATSAQAYDLHSLLSGIDDDLMADDDPHGAELMRTLEAELATAGRRASTPASTHGLPPAPVAPVAAPPQPQQLQPQQLAAQPPAPPAPAPAAAPPMTPEARVARLAYLKQRHSQLQGLLASVQALYASVRGSSGEAGAPSAAERAPSSSDAAVLPDLQCTRSISSATPTATALSMPAPMPATGDGMFVGWQQ